jgi:hypothetical protein
MAITGHRTRSVFERYNIVSDTDLRQAVEKQQAYLDGLSTEKPISKPMDEPREWQSIVLEVGDGIEVNGARKSMKEVMEELKQNGDHHKNTDQEEGGE